VQYLRITAKEQTILSRTPCLVDNPADLGAAWAD